MTASEKKESFRKGILNSKEIIPRNIKQLFPRLSCICSHRTILALQLFSYKPEAFH